MEITLTELLLLKEYCNRRRFDLQCELNNCRGDLRPDLVNEYEKVHEILTKVDSRIYNILLNL